MNTAQHYEGVMSLVQMAVARAMEKAGITDLQITREDLATAHDDLLIVFTNGVHTGMTFHVERKRIEPTDEVPSENATSYKPLDRWQIDILAWLLSYRLTTDSLRSVIQEFQTATTKNEAHAEMTNSIIDKCLAAQDPPDSNFATPADAYAARWVALCEKAFGPGGHLAANIVENMDKLVALRWTPEVAKPELVLDANDIEFLAARLRRLFNHFGYRLPDFAKDDKHLIGIAPTCIGAVLANLGEKPAPAPAPEVVAKARVDCGYCHGEGHLTKGTRRLVCPDCKGEGSVEAEA